MDECCHEGPIELEIARLGKTLAPEVGRLSCLLSLDFCFL